MCAAAREGSCREAAATKLKCGEHSTRRPWARALPVPLLEEERGGWGGCRHHPPRGDSATEFEKRRVASFFSVPTRLDSPHPPPRHPPLR